MTTQLSRQYDYDASHFRFARKHSGDAPAKTDAISGWWTDAVKALCWCAAIYLAWKAIAAIPFAAAYLIWGH